MLDHVYVSVSDPTRSLAFYLATLEPLGWSAFGNYDSSSGPDTVPDLWGLSDAASAVDRAINSIWLRQRKPGETGLYMGIRADTNDEVDTAYTAALRAGGRDDGAPAMRLHFAHGYYAANVIDLDDNRLELVAKVWNQKKRS